MVGIIATLAVPLGRSSTAALDRPLGIRHRRDRNLRHRLCFSTQVWAQQYTPPAHTALIFALEPVFAALTSRVVTKEHLGGKVLLGSALILAGMVISEVWGGAAPAPVEG